MRRRLFKWASFGLLVVLVAGAGFGFFKPLWVSNSVPGVGLSPIEPDLEFVPVDTGGSPMAAPTSTTGMEAPEFDYSAGTIKAPDESTGGADTPALTTGSSETVRGGTIYQPQYQSPLTAGQVDDNAKYQEYLNYLQGYYGGMIPIDVSQRLFIRVLDSAQSPVAGARVQLFDGDRQVFDGQTVSDGRALFLPKAAGITQAQELRAVISRGQSTVEATVKIGGPERVVTLAGMTDNTGPVGIDMVFLLDATGSMGDEIDKIKETVGSIAGRIEQLPGSSAPRFGLVAFRDRGDDYVTRQWDFTSDISQFSANLANVEAAGGGDTPESVDAGLDEAIHLQGWADNSTGRRLRLIVLVGDAPPHLDYANDPSYPTLLNEAVARGIKIFPVGASSLDTDGEYVFRQFAQVTQGQFVFLTYANGVSGAPGVYTDKHVDNFTVQNLDSLIVGLVAGEVANQTGEKIDSAGDQPVPVREPVVAPVRQQNLLDTLGGLFDGDRAIYLGLIVSIVLAVVYSTRREKARVEVSTQEAEIYVPENSALGESTSGPSTAPLTYFRRAEERDESDLAAAHIQPNTTEVSLHVEVQPAASGRTIPLP